MFCLLKRHLSSRDAVQQVVFIKLQGLERRKRHAMPRVAKSSKGAAPVGVISKVLRILEALQGSSAGLGLKAICDLTDIHKSTAHRFLKHLERERYLIRTEAGAYLIGPRLSQMSARGNQGATLQAVALGVVEVNPGNGQPGYSRPGHRALCRCDREPSRIPAFIAHRHAPFTARHCTGQGTGGFSSRRTTRKYFEHNFVSACDPENDHEPGAVPPGTGEDPAARLRGRRRRSRPGCALRQRPDSQLRR